MIVNVATSTNVDFNVALSQIKERFIDIDAGADFAVFFVSEDSFPQAQRILSDEFMIDDLVIIPARSFTSYGFVDRGICGCFCKFEGAGSLETFIRGGVADFETGYLHEELCVFLEEHADDLNVVLADFCDAKGMFFLERLGKLLVDRGIFANVIGAVSPGCFSNGVVRVLSFRNFSYHFSLVHGFRPVGPVYTVTESDGLRVFSVDGVRAYTLVERLLDGIEPMDIKALWHIPLLLMKEAGYFRVPRSYDPARGFVEFFAPVYDTDRFKFAFVDDGGLLEETRNISISDKRVFPDPDVVLSFFSVFRRYVLGEELALKEVSMYNSYFASPLVGMFSVGEIVPDGASIGYHIQNASFLRVFLRESTL